MVDFPDYSLDELKKILSNLRGDSAIEAQRDAVGQAEELARQAKQAQQPMSQLGDVLDKETAQSAVQSPAEAARKAAQAKLDAAAKGSVGEGVIANTPPTRQFDALEKLKTAAKGTVGDNVITSVPTSPGLERMASAEELASVGYKAPTAQPAVQPAKVTPGLERMASAEELASVGYKAPAAIETPVSSVANAEAKPVGQILKNLGQKFSNLTYDDVLNTLKSGGSKIKNIPQATKAALPEFANAAKIGANMLGEGAFNVAKDTAKLIPEAASAIDAGISTAGQAGLKGLRVAGSTPTAAAMAFLDPTETHVGPGEDSVESTAKRMRERLTPEEQAKVDAFAKHLEMSRIAGALPYQQKPDVPEEQVDLEEMDKKAQRSLGLGSPKNGDSPRVPASADTSPAPIESIMAGFAQAQRAANEGALAGQLGKAGALIGSGIVGASGTSRPTEVHDKIFDTNIAISQQIPEQYKQKIEMSRLDPASDISRSARDFIKNTLNITIPQNVSAQQLKEQFPVIEKMLQARENAELRKHLAIEGAKKRQADKELLLQERRERNIEKDFMSLGKQIEQGLASSRNMLGKNAGIVRGANAIQALASKWKPDELTNTEIVEIAKSLDAMLSQGAPTITGTAKLVPWSAPGDINKIAQYISGIPKGAQQGEFVKRLLGTVQREKELATRQIKDIQNRIIGVGGYHLREKAPEQFENLIQTYGLTPETATMHEVLSSDSSSSSPKASSSTQGGLVKIRDKKTGVTKTLTRDKAQKYLANPGFEEVK